MASDNYDSNLISILTTPMRACKSRALQVLTAYASYAKSASEGNIVAEHLEELVNKNSVSMLEVSSNKAEKFDDFKVSIHSSTQASGDFSKAKPGSVAVVPVRGVMMRESSFSFRHGFITGTRELEDLFQALDRSKNVDSIVVQLDSPGGQASGNESLARVIENISKPVVVSFEFMASAAVEAFAVADEIYALERSSRFGSIGTLISMVDDTEFWNKMGVKFTDVYAPQSEFKNEAFKKAQEGDQAPLKELLGKTTGFFIDLVKKYRPQIVDDGKIFKGKLYDAVDAKKIKAIDGIKDFSYTIKRASFLARKKSKMDNKENKESRENNVEKTEATKAAKDSETVTMTKEQKSMWENFKNLFSANQEEKSVEDQLQDAKNEVKSLRQEATSNKELITSLKADKEALTVKITALNNDVDSIKDAKLPKGATPFNSVSALVASYNGVFEHNVKLGGDGTPPNLPVNDKETEDITEEKNNNFAAKTVEQLEAEIEANLKSTEDED